MKQGGLFKTERCWQEKKRLFLSNHALYGDNSTWYAADKIA